MDVRDLALRLGLALALGFVIGLERGWKERGEDEGSRTAGLRTFSLIGLLGGIIGSLSAAGGTLLLAAGFVTTSAVMAAYMWREGEHDHDFSATSLVAAMLTFMLGALAVMGDMALAAGTGVATVTLLANKPALHGWLERLTWIELRSGLLLAAMTFIALPLLPETPVDPWGVIDLRNLWLMTILIAAVSFAGYVAVKLAGPRKGLLLAAALGGLFASTAVTLSLARLARGNDAHVKLLSGGILASGAVMMLRVLAIVAVLNPGLALKLAPILLAAAAVTGLFALVLVRGKQADGKSVAPQMVLKNPFSLAEVLRFGAILAAVIVAVELAPRFLGEPGLFGVAALSGLADVDAITLTLAQAPDVAAAAAADAILIAVGVNTAAKTVYAWYAGEGGLGRILLGVNAATIAVAWATRLLLV